MLVNNPFNSDPVNAYALLPVAVNSLLPQTFTLIMVHRYGSKSWYLMILTLVTWVLATIVIWALENFIMTWNAEGALFQGLTESVQHLSSVPSCGDTSALNLCIWSTGTSPLVNYPYWFSSGGKATGAEQSAAAIWSWCTFCLAALLYDRIHAWRTDGTDAQKPSEEWLIHPSFRQRLESMWTKCVAVVTSEWTFLIISAAFLVCFVFQFRTFYAFLQVGLVELDNWAFGQVIALTVWVPPLVEYAHLQISKLTPPQEVGSRIANRAAGGMKKGSQWRLPRTLTIARKPDGGEATAKRMKSLKYLNLTDVDETHDRLHETSNTGVTVSHDHESDNDNASVASAVESPTRDRFQLRGRPTLHMEQGEDVEA